MPSSGNSTTLPLLSLGHSACGSRAKPCYECTKYTRDEKVIVTNGLRLVRIRFGIPQTELPDLAVSELPRYLLFLLNAGKVRTSVPFPRKQSFTRSGENDGLCQLQRLCRRDRWNLAHSLNSIKRNLPSGCRWHTPSARPEWERTAFSSPPPVSSDYLRFVRKEVRKLFPHGWDRTYISHVESHVPNPTSRFEKERADLLMSRSGWKDFRRRCIIGKLDSYTFEARYKEVMSAGKKRPLVIYDHKVDYLAPLHKTINRALGRHSWVLYGPPTEQKITSTTRYTNNTSVDLVSATDNLSLEVTEAILGSILAKSTLVPAGIKLLAFASLYPSVDGREVTHGQMMGTYLSFPLLTLHSYLAARWATRGMESEVLVNGDDTLISSSSTVSPDMYPPGYKLNVSKTIFNSENVAEINSTVFLKSKGRWREVRHLRRGGFLTDFPGMMHAASSVRHSVAWTDAFVRSRIGKKWGFTPLQLGLHRLSYPAFCRDREFANRRSHTEIPTVDKVSQTKLSSVPRALDHDEQLATTMHMVDNGREGGAKRDVFSPSVGEVRRSFQYRKTKYWRHGSFLARVRQERLPTAAKVYPSFVLSEYVSMAEEKAIRALSDIWIERADE
ncbi:RNA dependent RNA polymerase [Plasmopara viticola lesion associated ourmia-like virus 51]|uniref:RNA dependent RNA polymerase n=1 Tax=Plasmopara viticola lesion associated ourmia-like virus 51 TaxID=2686522 RepID=A0ABX6FIX1_9VIRU|nr:RNA dependent RNA polymerase [Plasmopara viticola lesion associated ourmia-like virus 51]QGY72581.1 RNA dependent RNA polymerase [Plasmopara viticola lesion associated ourmia-like virus 51]